MRAMSLFKALAVVFIIGGGLAVYLIVSNLPDIESAARCAHAGSLAGL